MRLYIPFLVAAVAAHAQINFPVDLSISRLEVVQTVQDEDQNVPLTSGKATAVRAFVKQEGRPESLVAGIAVALRAFRNGEELPGSPIRPINLAITASPNPDRANPDHSQNFILPASWTTAGPLELRAELRIPSGTPEAPADNNILSRTVEFFPAPSPNPTIAWLPMCLGSSCVTGGAPYQRLVEKLMPFADGTLRYQDVPVPPVTWSRPPADATSGAALAAHLKKWLLLLDESPTPAHVLAAWLPAGATTTASSGGSADAFWIVEQPDALSNEQLLARQLATGYSVVADDPCGAFILDPGFDPVSGLVQSGSKLEFPAICRTANAGPWISAGLAHFLANGLPAFRAANSQTGSSRLLVSGAVRDDGSIAFTGFLRVSARVRTTLSAEPTGYVMRIADGAGTTDHTVSLPASGPFTVSVPVEGTIASLTLRREGTEIATAPVPSGSPSLSMLSPGTGESWTGRGTLRWTATDPAGRLMTYTVSYSADGGDTWNPLAIDIDATELALDTRYLAGTEARFRVIASAGIDQGQVVSEPVTLVNRPAMELSANTIEFGSVTSGQFADRTIMVRNTGAGHLTVDRLAVDRSVFRTLAPSPFQVRAGSDRALSLRIAPRAAGQETGVLTFTSNDETQPSRELPLRATVFDRPVASGIVAPSRLTFGEVPTGQSRELPVTVSNIGTAPLNVTSVSILNNRFNVISAGAFTLSPGASRTLLVRFAPTEAGEQSGSLSIATNDPATPSLRVDLRGAGLLVPQPQIDVDRLSLDFQGVNLNQSSSLSFNIRNGGSGPLNISALNVSNPVFAVSTPSLPVGVPPGARQIVSLRFTPTSLGEQTGTLTIVSNDPQRPQVIVRLTGSGLSAIPAPTPSISSLHPATIGAGSPAFTMTVTGSNFIPSSQAEWNRTALPTRFISSSLLRVTVPAQTVATAASASVTVTNPLPGGSSNAMPVHVDAPGNRARLVNFNLTGCPSVIGTMTVTNPLLFPITIPAGGIQCTEDGRPESLNCTAPPTLSGLSIVMVLHGSLSINEPAGRRNLDIGTMQRYALEFIKQTANLDRMAILQMDNDVRLRVDFRDAENREALTDQVRGLLPPLGGGTALFDSVEKAIDLLQSTRSEDGRRKAVLVFTGSGNTFDRNGKRDLDAFSQFLQSSGIPIYLVAIGAAVDNPGTLAELNQIALDTSGQLFAESGDITTRIGNLAASLRNQQTVNYTTPNRDGRPHQLRVNIALPGSGETISALRSYSGCR